MAKRAGASQGYINRGVVSRSRELDLPLPPALGRPILECCIQFWGVGFTTNVEKIGAGAEKSHLNDSRAGENA